MNTELNKLKKQIKLIEDLEIVPVDEETWHEICLTPARHEHKLLKEIAKVTFPQGENFQVHPNEITFNLNGFNIELPTCAWRGVKIDLKWFKPMYEKEPKLNSSFEKMRRYFELLDSGHYNWYDLAQCRRIGSLSKFKMFIWWFGKAKWHKVDRQEWENTFKAEDEQNERKLKEHEIKVEEIEMKLNKVNETIDILKEFAEVKGYVKIGDLWQTTNVENYFR